MPDNNKRPFLNPEEVVNEAFVRMGEDIKLQDNNYNEKISNLTVQELLEELKTDEFEKMYITTTAFSNNPNVTQSLDERINEVQSLAEYQLSRRSAEIKRLMRKLEKK